MLSCILTRGNSEIKVSFFKFRTMLLTNLIEHLSSLFLLTSFNFPRTSDFPTQLLLFPFFSFYFSFNCHLVSSTTSSLYRYGNALLCSPSPATNLSNTEIVNICLLPFIFLKSFKMNIQSHQHTAPNGNSTILFLPPSTCDRNLSNTNYYHLVCLLSWMGGRLCVH